MSDAPRETRLVTVRWFVRPSRTLVTSTVARGVGGPGSALWGSGGRLDLGAGDLAQTAPDDMARTLMMATLRPDSVQPMSRDQWVAWQRSWAPGGRQ